MAFSTDSVKRRSLGRWTSLLALATSSLCLGGCLIIENDSGGTWDDGGYVEPPPPPPAQPMLVSIQTDATVSAEPGEGVGIFVEYASEGEWRIWTTCDTNYSDIACRFDIFASVDVDSELHEFSGVSLEGRDQATLYEEGVVYLSASTASDIDEMRLVTTPGAIVRLEVYLDDVAQSRYVYWQGDGVLHQGAPSNPVDFEPTSP
ncbi:hypothetical protein [Chondromyces crocatus]|uniref:Uncharacterized protein n=1 Tax=Chondromyces crocatus TaxID=52 RepID=A0A0K1EF20_CHOCO|nr:hypothetical protein [Chondromyces crocatus]AKT39449.1 uncharacterized protein CMC5_035960 [Chondromyces crocatus]